MIIGKYVFWNAFPVDSQNFPTQSKELATNNVRIASFKSSKVAIEMGYKNKIIRIFYNA